MLAHGVSLKDGVLQNTRWSHGKRSAIPHRHRPSILSDCHPPPAWRQTLFCRPSAGPRNLTTCVSSRPPLHHLQCRADRGRPRPDAGRRVAGPPWDARSRGAAGVPPPRARGAAPTARVFYKYNLPHALDLAKLAALAALVTRAPLSTSSHLSVACSQGPGPKFSKWETYVPPQQPPSPSGSRRSC